MWCWIILLFALLAPVAAADHAPATAEAADPAPGITFLWQDVTHNLLATDLTAIAVDPANPRRVFVGAGQGLFRTDDGGRTWEQRLALRGDGAAVHAILVSPHQPQRVYLATAHGAFISGDGGLHWRRGGPGRIACLALLADPEHPAQVWIGTSEGLYQSADAGRTWRAVGGALAHQPIAALSRDPFAPEQLYVATAAGLMITADNGRTWRRSLLLATGGEPATDQPPGEQAETAPTAAGAVTTIACHPERPREVVVSTVDGALVSRDEGRSWQPLPAAGWPHLRLYDALITRASAPRLYVATDHGVWTFDDASQRWQELYRGMTARSVRQLAAQPLDGSLWAATDRGVFHGVALPEMADAPHTALKTWTLFQHEPAIDEVHVHAIRYSETNPAKIARWRRAAATKALLPTVSFSIARNNTVNDHYDEGTYPKFQLVPTRDLDRNLGVSVSWSLSELIWNEDQTAIDTRSKLTTELRNNIVAEVTQLYFERRRLQMEDAWRPSTDPKTTVDRALRVQELTAHIDALTGGWFSRALEGQ